MSVYEKWFISNEPLLSKLALTPLNTNNEQASSLKKRLISAALIEDQAAFTLKTSKTSVEATVAGLNVESTIAVKNIA